MLRIEIFQQTACYRIPQMGNPILTFPLAPPSTVFGLLRYITSYMSINKDNTRVAISGNYESKLRHIVTNHITGISDNEKYKSNIISTEELYNIKHIIHINSNEPTIEKTIKDNINKATRLGRKEDLIIDISCTECDENSNSKIDFLNIDLGNIKNINNYIYIPFNEKTSSMDALAMFNTPLDSDKSLLDAGFLKMYYVKVLYFKVLRILSNNNICNIDNDGYLYAWLI